jgi:hypothetical protein
LLIHLGITQLLISVGTSTPSKGIAMYKAKKNFACQGKTYFEGDKVPAEIAKGLPGHMVESPKAKQTPTYKDTLEGDN